MQRLAIISKQPDEVLIPDAGFHHRAFEINAAATLTVRPCTRRRSRGCLTRSTPLETARSRWMSFHNWQLASVGLMEESKQPSQMKL